MPTSRGIAAYLRRTRTDHAPWPDLEEEDRRDPRTGLGATQ